MTAKTQVPHDSTGARRLLITAGPTREPIDAVRYIGNRSSGRLGVELADEAARRGWAVTLLLGPTHMLPTEESVRIERFATTADLASLLERESAQCDVLVMAAAVADYRPRIGARDIAGKVRRMGEAMSLHLEPTPDLLKACSARRRPGQMFVGFALEPREDLLASARRKLATKGLDLIVANPLETMDSPTIEATLIDADGRQRTTDGRIDKARFAAWLLDRIAEHDRSLTTGAAAPGVRADPDT